MNEFDFIIAGAGAAGLTLAHRLSHSPLSDRSILLVDKDDDDQLRRNYGFWARGPTLYEEARHVAWRQLDILSEAGSQRIDLGSYEYHLVRGADFYRSTLAELQARPNVTFMHGLVDGIEDVPGAASVTVDGAVYRAPWAFDSLLSRSDVRRMTNGSAPLLMHFKGWEIRTARPAFDPAAATLFDFRCDQRGQVRFFYVMPFAPDAALVEFVVYSPGVLKQEEYDAALRDHIEGTRGIGAYQVTGEESGCLPLTTGRFPRRIGARVMSIGAKSGRLKPSTGYSLMRAYADAEAMVRSLIRHGHPFDVKPDPAWYQWLDDVMLDVMRDDGAQIKPAFLAMFARNPIDRILRFLDEEAGPADNLLLFGSLPKLPFVRAAVRRIRRPRRPRGPRATP